jgi:hypothetical protein
MPGFVVLELALDPGRTLEEVGVFVGAEILELEIMFRRHELPPQ